MTVVQPDRDRPLDRIPSQWHGKPTVLRLALGSKLRQLREASEITREAAGEAIRASHAKISRLELGRVGFKERDVADLLTLYGVTDAQERETFLALDRQANAPGWWREYGDLLPSWFETRARRAGSASPGPAIRSAGPRQRAHPSPHTPCRPVLPDD